MYLYYQTREKGHWEVIPETQVSNEKLQELGAKKLSILAVSQVVDEFTKKDELSYKGPLYFDIDCKEDIYEAIKSTKDLVRKLQSYDVADTAIQVYCSGSKGMHVIVDSRAFGTGRAVKNLPLIYKAMAKELYVFGLDYQVYSRGRGVSWRLPNIKRDDGKYRVQISLEELQSLTPETYRELVSAPREVTLNCSTIESGHAYRLQTLFERAKTEVRDLLKENQARVREAMEGEQVLSVLNGAVPQCVTDLTEGKFERTKNFNEIAVQLAAYTAGAGLTVDQAKDFFGPFSEVSESSTYSSARERFQHTVGLYSYVSSSSSSFTFSCGGMCSVISTKPCRECPVNQRSTDAEGNHRATDSGEGVSERLMESVDIAVRYDGYYAVAGDSERKLSTYTMEVTDYHEEPTQDGTGTRITGYIVMLRIEIDGKMEYREVPISEDAFSSRATLNSELRGIAGAVFYGSDTDAIKLKAFITSDQMRAKANKILTSYTAGVITHNIGKAHLNVYVDPDGSINEFKVQGTHYLNSDLQAPPEFFKVGLPAEGDPQVKDTIDNLLSINDDLTIACLVGWHTAVHFKSQIMSKLSQFPLLSIWGPAGVGKTQTASKFCFLNGCDYKSKYTPIITASSTPWALIDYCSTTSTVPRLLDEANETKMDRRLYEKFAEVVKASFNSSTMPRGSLKKTGSSGRGRTGATTISIPISSPIIMLSEQSQSMPAIQQRSLEIFLSHKGRAGRRHQFHALTGKEELLMSVGKAMLFKSLGTPVNEVCDKVEQYIMQINQDMDDRTIFAYATTLTGLELFSDIMLELGFDYRDKVKHLTDTLLNHINVSKLEEIMQNKMRTETDAVIETMAYMAQLSQVSNRMEIEEGIHYSIRNGTELLIDYKYTFPAYKKYCRSQGEKVIIKNMHNFLTLIQEESYYIDEEPPSGLCPRPMLVLDTTLLFKKGIDPTMFSIEAQTSE